MAAMTRTDSQLFREDERTHEEFIRRTNADLHSKYPGSPASRPLQREMIPQVVRPQPPPMPPSSRKLGKSDTHMFRQDERMHEEFIQRTNEDLHSQYRGSPGPTPRSGGPQPVRPVTPVVPTNPNTMRRTDSQLFRDDERTHEEFIRRTNQDLRSKYPGRPATPPSTGSPDSKNPKMLSRTDSQMFRQDEASHEEFIRRTNADLHSKYPGQPASPPSSGSPGSKNPKQMFRQDEASHENFTRKTDKDRLNELAAAAAAMRSSPSPRASPRPTGMAPLNRTGAAMQTQDERNHAAFLKRTDAVLNSPTGIAAKTVFQYTYEQSLQKGLVQRLEEERLAQNVNEHDWESRVVVRDKNGSPIDTLLSGHGHGHGVLQESFPVTVLLKSASSHLLDSRSSSREHLSPKGSRVSPKGAGHDAVAVKKDADELLFSKPQPKTRCAWWACCTSAPPSMRPDLWAHPKDNRPEGRPPCLVLANGRGGESDKPIPRVWNNLIRQCEAWGEEIFGVKH